MLIVGGMLVSLDLCRNNMRVVAILLILALAHPVDACVWVKGTTKDATRTTMHVHAVTRLRMQLRSAIETDLKLEGAEMERQLRGTSGFDERNDYAVALMYLGRADEAVKLLAQLEAEKPGEYATAANLGTAYELAGQNSEAKRWIDEGVKRDANSHYGTEWLHSAILTAKMEQEKDPNYFKNHSVLNLDYRRLKTAATVIPINGTEMEVKKITQALEYQLSERLKFVKGKDPVVASLLFDFAAITAGTDTLETASSLLQMAVEYGYSEERVNPLLVRYAALIRVAVLRIRFFWAGAALLAVAFLLLSYKRKWLVLTRQPAASALP
jgi:hypothetical protein